MGDVAWRWSRKNEVGFALTGGVEQKEKKKKAHEPSPEMEKYGSKQSE